MQKCIFIKGLHPTVTQVQIMNLFQSVSPVRSVKMLGQSRGVQTHFAQVNFFSDAAPANAVERHDGKTPHWNRGVSVQVVLPKKPEAPKPIGDWIPSLSRTYKKWYWVNKRTNETMWKTPRLPTPPPPQQQQEKPFDRSSRAKPKLKVKGSLIGKKMRMLIGGKVGLVVQRRGDGGEHRIVWDDGEPDDWVDLEKVLWEPFKERKKNPLRKEGGGERTKRRRERAGQGDDDSTMFDDSDEFSAYGNADTCLARNLIFLLYL